MLGVSLALVGALLYRGHRRRATLADLVSTADLQQAVAIYERHGVVVMRSFISQPRVAAMRQDIERRISSLPAGAPSIEYADGTDGYVFYDDVQTPSTLKQMGHVELISDALKALQDEMRQVAEVLLGEACASGEVQSQIQYFNKPPVSAYADGDASRPTPPHQDGWYWMIKPQSAGCTCWMALDAVDEENGCLRYNVAGNAGPARPAMRTHAFSQIKGFSQEIADYDASSEHEIPIPAAPGDLLVHGALTVHRAGSNRSRTRPRRAVGGTFFGASARVDEAAKAARAEEIRKRAATLEGQQGPPYTVASK